MKRNHHHGNLRAALVDAGIMLLDTKGIEAVTVRAVARGAGVSHAAPVNHFPDRRALLTAIAADCLRELAQIIAAKQRDKGTARERICALADAFHDYGLANPNRYRLMWRQDMLDTDDAVLKSLTDGLFESVAASMMTFGDPPKISAMSRIVAVCSAIHGYVLLRIDGAFQGYEDEKTGALRHRAVLEALLPN
jgi:AcrR family transcriptional regulator